MIRRLADRLVSVDLLDQASLLLQHQVDHRLQGAARAQVATRLAVIYLMNRKPDRALAVLRATQIAELSDTLRRHRLLLEARSLSELHRPDVALEVAANLGGREADRLRADILWSAKRWNKAAEAIEHLLGGRWRDWQPLDSIERTDVLRTGIGFALAEDTIGLARLRERYAAKMADGPDGRAFDVITSPIGVNGPEFQAVASAVGSIDTLEGFLRDMKSGFAESHAPTAQRPQEATMAMQRAAGPPVAKPEPAEREPAKP